MLTYWQSVFVPLHILALTKFHSYSPLNAVTGKLYIQGKVLISSVSACHLGKEAKNAPQFLDL